jgi:hypothetical protein
VLSRRPNRELELNVRRKRYDPLRQEEKDEGQTLKGVQQGLNSGTHETGRGVNERRSLKRNTNGAPKGVSEAITGKNNPHPNPTKAWMEF